MAGGLAVRFSCWRLALPLALPWLSRWGFQEASTMPESSKPSSLVPILLIVGSVILMGCCGLGFVGFIAYQAWRIPSPMPPPTAGVHPLSLSDCSTRKELLDGRSGWMVSAKYMWREGGPDPTKKYFFAVRSAHGLTSYSPVQLVAAGGTLETFSEVRPTDVPPVEGPFDVAVVTPRMTQNNAIVIGEYDHVCDFVRCTER